MTTVPLFQSRAFLTLLVDSIFSLITLIGGQVAGWNMILVGGIIAILQPLFIAAVVSFTKEDTVKLLMGVHPVQLLPAVVKVKKELLALQKGQGSETG